MPVNSSALPPPASTVAELMSEIKVLGEAFVAKIAALEARLDAERAQKDLDAQRAEAATLPPERPNPVLVPVAPPPVGPVAGG